MLRYLFFMRYQSKICLYYAIKMNMLLSFLKQKLRYCSNAAFLNSVSIVLNCQIINDIADAGAAIKHCRHVHILVKSFMLLLLILNLTSSDS